MIRFRGYRRFDITALLVPFIAIIIIYVFFQINNKILPSAIAISKIQAKSMANEIIDSSINETLASMQVKSSDFFIENNFNINSFSINTILVNSFCTDVNMNINKKFDDLSKNLIKVPAGAATGVYIFANSGPDISFQVMPMGEVDVDYETSFKAVGINQTNFKIWININLNIQIVNPLIEEKVLLTKKIMLVDTIINGEVPDSYLNIN